MNVEELHNSSVHTCKRVAWIGYYYQDALKTPIHKFACTTHNTLIGFLTTESTRELLVAGQGYTSQHLAARLREQNSGASGDDINASDQKAASSTYDARIYAHFFGTALEAVIGKRSSAYGSRRTHKRRSIARSVELETNLYLDALYFWTLEHMHPSVAPAPAWATSAVAEELRSWTSEQERWSFAATRAQTISPTCVKDAPRGAQYWDLALDAFEALSTRNVFEIEKALSNFGSNPGGGPVTLPKTEQSRERFWAEALCETIRESTLLRTGVPRLLQGIVSNIPAAFWLHTDANRSKRDPRTRPSQVLTWTLANLVYHLHVHLEQNIATQNNSRMDPKVQNSLGQLRESILADLPNDDTKRLLVDLCVRIENICQLFGLHALLLHEAITESPFKIKERALNKQHRTVDDVRPPVPEMVLCFKPPAYHREKPLPTLDGASLPCNRTHCEDNCRASSCMVLPCSDPSCRKDEEVCREFIRQLREQQATLNGTPIVYLKASLNRRGSTSSKTATNARARARKRDSAPAKAVWNVPVSEQPPEYSDFRQRVTNEVTRLSANAMTEEQRKALRMWISDKYKKQRYDEIVEQLKKKFPKRSDDETRVLASEHLLAEHYEGRAASHALDSIALGAETEILGFGDASSNSAMGREWKIPEKLVTLANTLNGLNAPIAFPNFELVVCPRPCPVTKSKNDAATP